LTAHPVGCGCAECQNPNLVKLVFRGKPTQSRAELFDGYSRQFRRAADSVFADNEQPELADRLRANMSRFAAYKSAYVEGEFARIAADPKYDDATRKAAMNAAEDRFARWTDAEYNTATARCRTAKQMAEFMEPDNVRLFPNLEWLATRSANPRAEHQAFVGLILPKEDDFWKTHTPGTEWNCKCDLAETDAPASNADNLPDIKPPRGLEGNPYHTGEVFTDWVGYIRSVMDCPSGAQKPIPTNGSRRIENKPFRENWVRKQVKADLHKIQGTSTEFKFENGEKIDVLFDSKTTSHIANDVSNSKDYLLAEISRHPNTLARTAKLIAHEPNSKLSKKPSAQHYYYYSYEIGGKTYYLNVEENLVADGNRHFFRLYSITTILRNTAIMY